MNGKNFLDVYDAAARYKVSASTVRRWYANNHSYFPSPLKRYGKLGWELATLESWDDFLAGVAEAEAEKAEMRFDRKPG